MKWFRFQGHKQTDEQLLESYRMTGDTNFIARLMDQYIHLIYGTCLKYLNDREESKDAVMEIFEILTRKLLVEKVAYFRSWLYVVTKNHCLMKLRKDQKIISIAMELTQEVHLTEEQDIFKDKDQELSLSTCMDQLKKEQADCIKMFFYENKSYRDISEQTPYSINDVKSYIQNGKRNLKICLEKGK